MKRRLFSVVVAMACGGGGAAWAAPKTVAVAMGDCRNAELLTGMTTFHDALRSRWRDELISPETVFTLTRPRAQLSLEDLGRQIESARTLYYSGSQAKQEQCIDIARQAITELEKISPHLKPWATLSDALLMLGNTLKALGRTPEGIDVFKRALRIDPALKVDPNLFPPSTQELVDSLRKEQKRARKSTLEIKSTVPGAEVFIDGKSFGKAPMRAELVAGTYRVSLLLGEQVSFLHAVTLPKQTSIQVDFAFEAALMPQMPLCLSSSTVPAEGLAQKLANAVSADKAVVFWRENRDGPPFYRALILNTGVKEREGGVQTTLSNTKPIDELANFIVTGQGSGVVTQGTPPVTPPITLSDVPAKASVLEPAADAPPPPHLEASSPGRLSGARIAGITLLSAGAAAAIAGVVLYATGSADRERLGVLAFDGALPPASSKDYPEALALDPIVRDNKVASFSLIGAGAGVAVAGALTVLLLPARAEPSAHIAFVPTAHGAMLGVGGSF